MEYTAPNFLVFACLLGGVAHLMLFQNGLWNDAMWLTAMISVGIPLVLYRFMKTKKSSKKSRRKERYAEI